jgi:hypothetical protein
VNGQVIRKALLLWRDTAPAEVLLEVSSKDGKVLIHNVWDYGDGVVHAWHNGAAMAIDRIDHATRRYSCNDGEPDDDLDDLVFTVHRETRP